MRNAQYCFVAYQNQYPVVCVTSASQKNTLSFSPPQSYNNSPAPIAPTPIFPPVSICTLKITVSIIVMVLKYQKQAANDEVTNYTKTKLIYVYIFVYTSKRDASLGFL